MDSLQLLWEIGLTFVQFFGALWPVTVFLLLTILFRVGRYLYKTRRYAKAGIADVDQLNGKEFEQFLEVLFRKLGYQVQPTPYQGDYGADLVLRRGVEKTVVQAKRSQRRVGVKAIQEAVAAKEYYRCDQAMVVTNSYFSRQAEALAKANRVVLWDRDKLVAHLIAAKEPKSVEFAASTAQRPSEAVALPPAGNSASVPRCTTCGKPVSAQVQAYCLRHAGRFHGLTYCYEHQKEIRDPHATR